MSDETGDAPVVDGDTPVVDGGTPVVDGGTPEVDGNVASRLGIVARLMPGAIAIAQPIGPVVRGGDRDYQLTTFGELDRRSTAIARGMVAAGIGPGRRIVMLVPFGAEFVTLVFALLKTGATTVLIDPGIDRRHLIDCLSESNPDGFVGIPKAQVIRWWFRRRFPAGQINITVDDPRRPISKWMLNHWPGARTTSACERVGAAAVGDAASGDAASGDRGAGSGSTISLPTRTRLDPAAIIFTTGSTGPPKGVLYTHGTFHAQIDRIADRYDIHRGSRDLACFPLFGLFDAVMGVTTIIPDMDPTRPAEVDPRRLIEAADQWQVDQAFGSPALWKTVVRWAERNDVVGRPFPSLRRILSAGAPVPASTLLKLRTLIHPDADIHTPYGSTEALPIASIESRQIITHTGPAAAKGKGVCVGHRFEGARWKVIEISDDPIADLVDCVQLPIGKIGELMVAGPMVTTTYEVRGDQNAVHKVVDHSGGTTEIWHRMGDVGYLDAEDRFWFCGRKGHRVVCGRRTLFTVPCEAIFNAHPAVNRSALVPLGERPEQTPVMVIELTPETIRSRENDARVVRELLELASRNPITRRIDRVILRSGSLPVDIRHNSKIFRERLAAEISRDQAGSG